jgi:hypothetical protein
MDDVVLLNKANRDIVAGVRRVPSGMEFQASEIFNMVVQAFSVIVMLFTLTLTFSDKRQHDLFVANSQITEATIDRCFKLGPFTVVQFTFPLEDQRMWGGETTYPYRDSCDNHRLGQTLPVRYSPSEPNQVEALDHRYRGDQIIYLYSITILIILFMGVLYVVRYLKIQHIKRSGQVHQGRIMEIKNRGRLFLSQIRYEVHTGDGSSVVGKRFVKRDQAEALTPGMPLAVLYADPKTHFVL